MADVVRRLVRGSSTGGLCSVIDIPSRWRCLPALGRPGDVEAKFNTSHYLS
jgi:hypothetical protein